jgi:type I restriction enzyme S subunit
MSNSDWKFVKLGDLVDITHGYAFKGDFFREDPPGDILLTPSNFAIGGGFKSDKLKYYVGNVPEDFILKKNDLLVTMTDLSKAADTLGYPALIPQSPKNSHFLHNQRLGKVIINNENLINKYYLYYQLRTDSYRNEVLASATGTTVKHTSPNRIQEYQFCLPPLPEQKAIAHILGTLDDKIELNQKMNETLEAMARAIFKSWFVDFDPVRAKMEGKQPVGMDTATADLFPDSFEESALGLIPRGWEVKSLDKIANFLNGLALQKYPPEDETNYLPVIKIAELRQGITEKSGKASVHIKEEYIIQNGDIIFSWSGSLVNCIWCGGQGALNQHLFKVTSQDYPKWFYYQWINYHLPDFQFIAASKATTMGHIQRHHLSDALVIVSPSDLLLTNMDKIMNPLIEKIIINNLETQTLTNIRDTLLPKLMSGEIRVKEAERMIEEVI